MVCFAPAPADTEPRSRGPSELRRVDQRLCCGFVLVGPIGTWPFSALIKSNTNVPGLVGGYSVLLKVHQGAVLPSSFSHKRKQQNRARKHTDPLHYSLWMKFVTPQLKSSFKAMTVCSTSRSISFISWLGLRVIKHKSNLGVLQLIADPCHYSFISVCTSCDVSSHHG